MLQYDCFSEFYLRNLSTSVIWEGKSGLIKMVRVCAWLVIKTASAQGFIENWKMLVNLVSGMGSGENRKAIASRKMKYLLVNNYVYSCLSLFHIMQLLVRLFLTYWNIVWCHSFIICAISSVQKIVGCGNLLPWLVKSVNCISGL